jgi:clan AA aspartic protease
MISGAIRGREARIGLKVRGPRGKFREIEAVIDTGYTASLTLPRSLVAALGLRWKGTGRGILADGSQCLFDVYLARIIWDGKERTVLVDEADTEPLVGMALLSGCRLTMDVRSRGKVTIKRLPTRSIVGKARIQLPPEKPALR